MFLPINEFLWIVIHYISIYSPPVCYSLLGKNNGLLRCCCWMSGNMATKNSLHPPILTRIRSYFSGYWRASSKVSGSAQVMVIKLEPILPFANFSITFTRSFSGKSSLMFTSTGAALVKPRVMAYCVQDFKALKMSLY